MLKIGHRGACGYEPENTLRSFQKAIELGVDVVECDAHLSKDGRVVIMHDDTVDRTTNGSGRIDQLTYGEITELDAGEGEIVPTLEEVIDLCRGKCELNVEVKGIKPAQRVAEIVIEKDFVDQTVVSSNYIKSLKIVKQISPEVRTALLYWATKSRKRQIVFNIASLLTIWLSRRLVSCRAHQAGADTINLSWYLATTNTVRYLHRHNFKLNVWTVNEPEDIKQMKSRGVDGIISNYPDRI